MINYKFGTYVMRFFVYILLFILLIVTIVPIWLLIVNATRSTTEIQQGHQYFAKHAPDRKLPTIAQQGIKPAERLREQPVPRRRFDGCHGLLLVVDSLWPGCLQLPGQKTIFQLYHRIGHDPLAAFHYWFLSVSCPSWGLPIIMHRVNSAADRKCRRGFLRQAIP